MNSELNQRYFEIRDFFVPIVQKYAEENGDEIGASLDSVKDPKVREFFLTHEFCRNWIADLAVPYTLDYAYDCEGREINKLAELYTSTEFGPVMFEKELFCFAESTAGSTWVVSLATGKVFKMLASWNGEREMSEYIEHSWDSFFALIDDIKKTGLEYTVQ